jgi:hypothetical protein
MLVAGAALRVARRLLGCDQRYYRAAIEFRFHGKRIARPHTRHSYRCFAWLFVFFFGVLPWTTSWPCLRLSSSADYWVSIAVQGWQALPSPSSCWSKKPTALEPGAGTRGRSFAGNSGGSGSDHAGASDRARLRLRDGLAQEFLLLGSFFEAILKGFRGAPAENLPALRDDALAMLRNNNQLLEASRNEPSGGTGLARRAGMLSRLAARFLTPWWHWNSLSRTAITIDLGNNWNRISVNWLRTFAPVSTMWPAA